MVPKSALRASMTHLYTEMLTRYGSDSQLRLSQAQREVDEGIDRIWKYIHGLESGENIENLFMKWDWENYKKSLKNLMSYISELDEQKVFDSNEFVRRVPRWLRDFRHFFYEDGKDPKDMKEHQPMYEKVSEVEDTWIKRSYVSAFVNGMDISNFAGEIIRGYDLQEPIKAITLTYIILENFLDIFHFVRIKTDFEFELKDDKNVDIEEFLKEEDSEIEFIRMLFLGSVLNDSLLNYSLENLKKELHQMTVQKQSKSG